MIEPFTERYNGMSLAQLQLAEQMLVAARKQLDEHGWIKGKMYADGEGNTLDQGTCAAGAIDAGIHRNGVDGTKPDACTALNLVYAVLGHYMRQHAIKHNWLSARVERRMAITELNDLHFYRVEPLLVAFDDAIMYVRTAIVTAPEE